MLARFNPLSYVTLLQLCASIRFSKELGWSVSRGRTKIAIENIIDFLTIFDLYVNHHYAQLEKAVVPGCIVWDIGANLCATSC